MITSGILEVLAGGSSPVEVLDLFTILYAGLVASGVAFALQIWCIDRGGPLFTAVFQPVQTVAVAVMAAIILGDQLYTGG